MLSSCRHRRVGIGFPWDCRLQSAQCDNSCSGHATRVSGWCHVHRRLLNLPSPEFAFSSWAHRFVLVQCSTYKYRISLWQGCDPNQSSSLCHTVATFVHAVRLHYPTLPLLFHRGIDFPMDYDVFRDQLAASYPTYGHALWDPSSGGLYNIILP